MSVRIIQERLATYGSQTAEDEVQAAREITQEITLAALSRAGFFKVAAFQGGTCLRILYGLERFSEDLDFVLQNPDSAFSFDAYVTPLALELAAYGYQLEIADRSKVDQAVKKIFIKDQSVGKQLVLRYRHPQDVPISIKIKLEVDVNPPAGSHYDQKFLDFPFPFAVTVQDPPSLFASKCHALLCREYVKGRDWFDLIWYVARKTQLNFELLGKALTQAGPWRGQTVAVDAAWVTDQLSAKIRSMNWQDAKDDIVRFLKPHQLPSLDLWGPDYFLSLIEKLRASLQK